MNIRGVLGRRLKQQMPPTPFEAIVPVQGRCRDPEALGSVDPPQFNLQSMVSAERDSSSLLSGHVELGFHCLDNGTPNRCTIRRFRAARPPLRQSCPSICILLYACNLKHKPLFSFLQRVAFVVRVPINRLDMFLSVRQPVPPP